jgi:NAD+ kinase
MQIFKTIGITGRYRNIQTIETVVALIHFLEKKNIAVFLDSELCHFIPKLDIPSFIKPHLPVNCDLLIVIGGDGNLLGAAKIASENNVPVLGINRGTLGFLTDISPHHFEIPLENILSGHYDKESRFLLDAAFIENEKIQQTTSALNDIVLMPGDIPHMIEFEIYINDVLMCHQRADGLIIATPTGSTAYALSGGGPILHPNLDAIVLVPMFPHKLSSRPIVITGDSEITLIISPKTESPPKISCDGQERLTLNKNTLLTIKKRKQHLCLLHPKNHNYFETLRNKLGWEESKI